MRTLGHLASAAFSSTEIHTDREEDHAQLPQSTISGRHALQSARSLSISYLADTLPCTDSKWNGLNSRYPIHSAAAAGAGESSAV
eukprot:scaffold9950_cov73-Skeletonema_marinoi.AAC.1